MVLTRCSRLFLPIVSFNRFVVENVFYAVCCNYSQESGFIVNFGLKAVDFHPLVKFKNILNSFSFKNCFVGEFFLFGFFFETVLCTSFLMAFVIGKFCFKSLLRILKCSKLIYFFSKGLGKVFFKLIVFRLPLFSRRISFLSVY